LADQLYKKTVFEDENVGRRAEELEARRRESMREAGVKLKEEEEKIDKKDGNIEERDSNDGTNPDSSGDIGGDPTPTGKDVVIVPLVSEGDSGEGKSNTYLIIMISVCCVFGVLALIGASICYYNVQTQKAKTKEIPYMTSPVYEYKTMASTNNKSGLEPSYPQYPMDNALALSAQKFHFQHEKEKLIAMENEKSEMEPVSQFSVDCTDEVYETPGLAPMWDVEVDCPVYSGEVTPGTTPRQHTPMMRTESGSSEEEEEGEGLTNGGYVNGDSSAHVSSNERQIDNNNISNDNLKNISEAVNGLNGYHD